MSRLSFLRPPRPCPRHQMLMLDLFPRRASRVLLLRSANQGNQSLHHNLVQTRSRQLILLEASDRRTTKSHSLRGPSPRLRYSQLLHPSVWGSDVTILVSSAGPCASTTSVWSRPCVPSGTAAFSLLSKAWTQPVHHIVLSVKYYVVNNTSNIEITFK